jgi:hypothetical protein
MDPKQLIDDAIALFGADKVSIREGSDALLKYPYTVGKKNPLLFESYNVKQTKYEKTGLTRLRLYDRDIKISRRAPRQRKKCDNLPKSTSSSYQGLSKARARLENLILANKWQFWGYVSFDPKMHPWCFDYEVVKQKVVRLLKTFKAKHDRGLEYLLVFEKTEAGQLHCHMLLSFSNEVRSKMTKAYHPKTKRPIYKRFYGSGKNKVRLETPRHIHNWDYWADKYGHTNFDPIGSLYNDTVANEVQLLRIARYLSKYMLKESLDKKKRYLVSKALSRPKVSLRSIPDPNCLVTTNPNAYRLYKIDRKIVNQWQETINFFNEYLIPDE